MLGRGLYAPVLLVLLSSCSLPLERAITKQELFSSGIYNQYVIKDAPESVLSALNKEGEVVLDAKYKETPVFVKIMATSKGLKVTAIEQ